MDKVKKLIDAGLPITAAIKQALGSTTEFADKYELPRGTTSEVVNATRVPTEKQLNALIAELGGTEAEWRSLLWLAAKPESAVA